MHFTQLQFLLPQQLLSQIFGWLAESSNPLIRRPLIGLFRRLYRIDMEEYERSNSREYRSFNDFFTRQLKAGARPLDSEGLLSPADGAFASLGKVEQGSLLQAKNRSFSLRELLAESANFADYEDADFATIYLAPTNYHRVHIPLDSTLNSLTYVPGRQFSVNATSTRHIPDIYAKNERLIAQFSTAEGNYCLIMVGALLVAGMSTVITGPIPRRKSCTSLEIPEGKKFFQRGEEFGAFRMGSTVILLYTSTQKALTWSAVEGQKIQYGQRIGDFTDTAD